MPHGLVLKTYCIKLCRVSPAQALLLLYLFRNPTISFKGLKAAQKRCPFQSKNHSNYVESCCKSSTSNFHIFRWMAASFVRSAIFTARITGSGEVAWRTPITITYLPGKHEQGDGRQPKSIRSK